MIPDWIILNAFIIKILGNNYPDIAFIYCEWKLLLLLFLFKYDSMFVLGRFSRQDKGNTLFVDYLLELLNDLFITALVGEKEKTF